MVKYNQAIQNSGLSLIAKGTYSKTYKDGKPMKFGKYPMPPEGILIFNKSGKEVKLPNGFDIQAVAPLYKGHYQTEKAAVLLRAIIDGTTKVGDMVLDPFSGSGVTLDEAIKSGRFAYGIEQSTEAVEKHIKPRLEKSAEEDVMANISTTDFGVETFLASKEVVALVDKFKQTVNPNIRELLRWEILKMYKDENGNTLEGYFRRSDMTIGTVLEMPYEKVLGVLREEVGHAAFSLMSSKERQQIVDWYKQLSERDLVNIFGKKTLGAYRLQNKDNDFDMADEAIQWAMRNKEFYTDSKIVKKVKAAIKKLLVLLNKITKGLLFTKTIEKIDTRNDAFSLFGEVFSQTGGETFARSVGFKEELFARQGGTAGHIIFKDGENYADKGKIMASIKKTEEAILKEVETKKKESSSFRSILKLYAQKYQELTGVPMPASFAETLSDRYIANIMRNQKKEGLVEGTQIARQKSLQQQAKLRKILTERIERKNRIKNARTVDRKDIAVYSAKEKLNEKIAEKNKTIAEKKEFMKLAVDNITQMLPPSERGRNGLLARVTKIKNLDELNTLIKDVWEARDAYEIRTKKEADIKAKRAERTALYAQELRDRLTKFKDTVKSWDERRALLRKYVRSTFPIGANLKQFLNAIGRSKTDEHVQQIIEKVDSVRRDYERKQTQKEIKRLLKYNKNAKKYTALKKFPIKIRMEIEKIAAGYKSASLNELIRMRNDIYAYRLLGKKMMDANQAIHDMNVDNRLTMLEESGGINLDSYDPKLELNSEARGAIKLLQKMKKQINTGAIYMFTVDRILDVIGGSDHYNSPLFQIFKTSLDIKRHDADNATDFNIKFFWGMVNAKGLTGMATPGILKQYITGKLNLDGTLKKHEWSNAERIMIHATRVQEHGSDIEYGRNLLINQGLSEETIDSVVLNEEEMTMYNFMRERFDAIHPALAEEYMRTHNELLPFIKNYFPIMTDFNSSGGVNAFHDALSQDYRRASVKFGSLESRVGGFERPLQMDSFKVYETYMKRANYWLHMNASLKDLNELNNNERFIAKYGKLAHNYIAEYLDVVARMGSITGQEYHPIIDAIRTNFSVYTLGLRPTSQMIQYLAWINGSAEIGLPYATKGVGYILQDEWRKFAFNNSSELRNRTGHDIALRDATNRGYTDRVSELSMAPTAFGDKNTAGAIWTGAYKKSLDEQGKTMDFEHPDQIALNYANLSVRLTQGSTDYKDLPQILRGKNRSWMKVAFMFQSFTLSSISNYMMHDIGGYVTKQDKARTAQQITLMATAFLAEAGLRAAIAIAVANMVGDDKELDKRKKENLFMSAIINAMNSMPGLSQASNVIQYGNNPVPLAAFFQKYAGAAHQSVSAGTAKGQQKAWLQFITMNAGVYYGLPLDYVEKLVEKIVF
jgi:hypothetical protein